MIKERGLPQGLTAAQQTVLVGGIAELFTLLGTIAYVETRSPEERAEARRAQYATLAGATVVGGLTAALVLALNSQSDGLVGNVG